MVKTLYKRIIRKLGLSKEQLSELRKRLSPENICKGPFVQGDKNCPATTALAIKEGRRRFKESDVVKKLLKQHGVVNAELTLFYIQFDIPSMISERLFERSLLSMREAIDELLKENGG